jgi:type IV fimbrial biogenesis protein FimT
MQKARDPPVGGKTPFVANPVTPRKTVARDMGMRHENGFTIIELMITIAIAALLLTLGVPALQDMVRNNRLVSQTNNLVGDIQLARGEAIKRNTQVAMCRSNDLDATPTCGGSTQDWTTGWLVFADANGNGTYESAGDTLLRVGYQSGNDATIFSNATADTNVRFAPDGTLNLGAVARFAVCDGRSNAASFGRQIDIGLMGRPTLIKGSSATPISSCTNPS